MGSVCISACNFFENSIYRLIINARFAIDIGQYKVWVQKYPSTFSVQQMQFLFFAAIKMRLMTLLSMMLTNKRILARLRFHKKRMIATINTQSRRSFGNLFQIFFCFSSCAIFTISFRMMKTCYTTKQSGTCTFRCYSRQR